GSKNDLNSDLLRTFVAIAQYGNVTRAASALHRTQSAVSVQLKRLEDALQTKVFARQARGMALTEAGHRLLPIAERIVGDLEETARVFTGNSLGGTVRVGIPDDYGSEVLPGILSDFAKRHPAVEVFVRCEVGADFEAAIANGDLDLAVSARRIGRRSRTDLFEEPTCWVCSRNTHPDLTRPIPLALFDRSCWWRDSALATLKKAGIAHRIAYTSESVTGIHAAISTGLAIGTLARSTINSSMKILDSRYGFPELPGARLSLFHCDDAKDPAVAAMAAAIKRGFQLIADNLN
ncbi:MAG: LysR substrate-binding domain-containing protein, partial [Pseudomonadota bacterium]